MSNTSKNIQRRQRVLTINQIGQRREKSFSQTKYCSKNNILIHPHFLRRRQCGQIDFAILKNDYGIIYEIKGRNGMNGTQRKRLFNSARLLGEIFQKSFLIKTVCFKENSITNFDII